MWKITAHYDGDEENVASREFKVQKFGEQNPLVMCVMSCLKVTLILLFIYLFIFTHSSFTQL